MELRAISFLRTVRYGEVSIADFVEFDQSHPSDFPRGIGTTITLGDFEGNTYHSSMVMTADRRNLHLMYELNEP